MLFKRGPTHCCTPVSVRGVREKKGTLVSFVNPFVRQRLIGHVYPQSDFTVTASKRNQEFFFLQFGSILAFKRIQKSISQRVLT